MSRQIAPFLARILSGPLLLLAGSAFADDPGCHRDWLCLHTHEAEEGVDYLAENIRSFPVTLSYRLDTQNLKLTESRPETVVVPGNKTIVLAKFTKLDVNAPFRITPRYDWVAGSFHAKHDDSVAYRLPYDASRAYSILQGYGGRFSHDGDEHYTLDFNMRTGTPVHAARAGVVIDVVSHNDKGGWDMKFSRYANFIVIEHEDGTTGEYYHLSKNGAFVQMGDMVEEGQLIGLSGNTGHTAMPHLHFGVYQAGEWGRAKSVPVRFKTRDGLITNPRRGRRYFVE